MSGTNTIKKHLSIIYEFHEEAKPPQGNSDFMNKIILNFPSTFRMVARLIDEKK